MLKHFQIFGFFVPFEISECSSQLETKKNGLLIVLFQREMKKKCTFHLGTRKLWFYMLHNFYIVQSMTELFGVRNSVTFCILSIRIKISNKSEWSFEKCSFY